MVFDLLYFFEMRRVTLNTVCILFILFFCGASRADTNSIEKTANSLISGFDVISGQPYRWSLLEKGTRVYINRKRQTYTEVPTPLAGQLTLRTSNNDKFFEAVESPFISFKVKKKVKVYVLYSNFYTQLEEVWLNDRNGWRKEDFVVKTNTSQNKATRLVRSKIFPAGSEVKLDGNGCVIKNCSMYTVVIVPIK